MTGLEWLLSTTLFMLYLLALFTVCSLTFRKGYVGLGIVGIFLPFLADRRRATGQARIAL